MSVWDLLADIDRDSRVDPCGDARCESERRGVVDWAPSPVVSGCGVVAAVDAAYAAAVRRGVADESVPVLQVLRYRWDEIEKTMSHLWWKNVATGEDVYGMVPHGSGSDTYRVVYTTEEVAV